MEPPTPPAAQFGAALRRHRRAAGLTQEELAARAGLSARGLSDLERGISRAPQPYTLDRLLAALGLSPADQATFVAVARHGRIPASGDAPAVARPPGLPVSPTPLIGRERAVVAATALLRDGATRLLTIVGPPGVGKTRLGLAVAAAAGDACADGVAWVDLAPLADPALVLPTMAQALGVRDVGGRPLLAGLIDALRDRQRLLALDNFEHVVDAAPLVADLLAACPRLAILVTSRVALRLRGEREFPLAPLAVPDLGRLPPPDDVARVPAVALFCQRVAEVRPDFALTAANARAVAVICTRLDGLPLAIELAAARVRVLPPAALVERLGRRLQLLTGGARDMPARHRTLRAALDWSHDLLPAPERAVFRRLAVFAGGATLAAVAAVAGEGDLTTDETLDCLAELVAHSLVVAEPGPDGEERFRLLETLREYAWARLHECGEAEAWQRRHAEHCLTLAAAAEPPLFGVPAAAWRARLAAEAANLRAALAWAVAATDDGELALRLTAALAPYWVAEGRVDEGQRWLAAALARPAGRAGGDPARQAARAQALLGAASLALEHADYAAARDLAEESLGLWRVVSAPAGQAWALSLLGRLGIALTDWEMARDRLTESLALLEGLGDRFGSLWGRVWLANEALFRGEYAAARTHLEAARAAAPPDDSWGQAFIVGHLGVVAVLDGEPAYARTCLATSLAAVRALGDQWSQLYLLEFYAWLAAVEGRAARAARLAGAVTALSATAGVVAPPVIHTVRARLFPPARTALGESAWQAAWTTGEQWSLARAIAEAEPSLPPEALPASDRDVGAW